ncbi:hypothetical protein SAMN05216348_1094 [Olsenella sp. KH3B4]|uniref:hypothetical protein n=1 Tax=Olsenella sp. KH3B4 TaxID=1855394 RepID=UPI0008CF6772|nr:hypothetical protein [Olsenella sp. KH3B4]SET18123.1 hypothetical protein SAMN05216348_1094 [Olsenella sp. KH3B4]
MKEKTKRRLRLLARVVGGICVALVVLALALATHTQIAVGAIQALSAGTVKTTNTYEPEGEPMDAVRDNGQRIVTDIAYADEYPNSFLDITYPDSDTSVRRPTSVYSHGGGFFGGGKGMGDPLASSVARKCRTASWPRALGRGRTRRVREDAGLSRRPGGLDIGEVGTV